MQHFSPSKNHFLFTHSGDMEDRVHEYKHN
jgi:hypothetical protein